MPFVPGVAPVVARRSLIAALSLAALFAAIGTTLVAAPAASAKIIPGGVSARSGLEAEIPESTEEVPVETETGEIEGEVTQAGKAALVNGRAIAPLNAPAMVKRVIAAANHIRTTPYVWGGGHGSFISSGYDCSGAVSYALHGGKLLSTPLTSGSLETFGEAGPGRGGGGQLRRPPPGRLLGADRPGSHPRFADERRGGSHEKGPPRGGPF